MDVLRERRCTHEIYVIISNIKKCLEKEPSTNPWLSLWIFSFREMSLYVLTLTLKVYMYVPTSVHTYRCLRYPCWWGFHLPDQRLEVNMCNWGKIIWHWFPTLGQFSAWCLCEIFLKDKYSLKAKLPKYALNSTKVKADNIDSPPIVYRSCCRY